MKQLIKIFSKKIIIFLIGIVIGASLGVSASVLFNSSDVSYDNVGTGMSSTNVQDAIDELFDSKTSGSQIKFVEVTSQERIVDCGFKPDIIIAGYGYNSINYPQLYVIDYMNEKAINVFYNNSSRNGGVDFDYNGYGFNYLTGFVYRTDTGVYIPVITDGTTSRPNYVWCIK